MTPTKVKQKRNNQSDLRPEDWNISSILQLSQPKDISMILNEIKFRYLKKKFVKWHHPSCKI